MTLPALAQSILWEQDCAGDVFLSPIMGGQHVICAEFPPPTDTPTATATPTETATATVTPTPTDPPISAPVNLLLNPYFVDPEGNCTNQGTSTWGWSSQYFTFPDEHPLSTSPDQCFARAKGSNYPAGGIIPPGQSGLLWQTVATGNYSVITLEDAYINHEDGQYWHRLFGCQDAAGADCVLVFETDKRAPDTSESKSTCDVFWDKFTISTAGTVERVVSHYQATCPTDDLPAPETWTIAPFGQYPFFKLEIEVNPIDSPSGGTQSGVKIDEMVLMAQ